MPVAQSACFLAQMPVAQSACFLAQMHYAGDAVFLAQTLKSINSIQHSMAEPSGLKELISTALSTGKSLDERMGAVDMLRLSKNPLAISSLIQLLLSGDADAKLKKNCEDSIFFFGTKSLPHLDEVMAHARNFMVHARINGSTPYNNILEANNAHIIMQNLMSKINTCQIRESVEFKKPGIFAKNPSTLPPAKIKTIKTKTVRSPLQAKK